MPNRSSMNSSFIRCGWHLPSELLSQRRKGGKLIDGVVHSLVIARGRQPLDHRVAHHATLGIIAEWPLSYSFRPSQWSRGAVARNSGRKARESYLKWATRFECAWSTGTP